MGAALVYGAPPAILATVPPDAVQASPLMPGATRLEDLADASFDEAVVLAPPGSIERAYALAQALRILRPGGRLTALAPKVKGGARLRKELESLGCAVHEDARRHHRICRTARPESPAGLAAAITAGAPRFLPGIGLWSQPGVFSWDRIDHGTALLLDRLPPLEGRGADLGAGVGVLARRVLESPKVTALTLVDVDGRAVEISRRNVEDPRAAFVWGDARRLEPPLSGLDFVVMNPPFHEAGAEDRALGAAFVAAAGGMLRPGGACWMVANRHLPYEAVLEKAFASVALRAESGGYKVFEARR